MVSDHPLVAVHPETGERSLFVSPSYVKSVVGMPVVESTALLEELWKHCIKPEYCIKYAWTAGDFVVWDEISTMHRAPTDIFETEDDRCVSNMHHLSLIGQNGSKIGLNSPVKLGLF
jgi:taurine dioxygenase